MGYRKPAAVLLALRNHVVGRETFDQAFREYTRRWAFKHPTPGDFFRTIENVTGRDLSWYWRAFWYTTDLLDIGIEGIATRSDSGRSVATIALRRMTPVPFPVELRLRFADGSLQDVRLPVEIWAAGDRFVASVPVRGQVTGARLWPDPAVPDWNSANDTWGNAPAGMPLAPVTAGGLNTRLPQGQTAGQQ
jgi:hypothetical protein